MNEGKFQWESALLWTQVTQQLALTPKPEEWTVTVQQQDFFK